jgi:hypothetical protein
VKTHYCTVLNQKPSVQIIERILSSLIIEVRIKSL